MPNSQDRTGEASGPATSLQGPGNFGGHLAGPVCDVGPAIPQRDDPVCRVGVVTAGVAPAGVGRVRHRAVEFHAGAVILVADVLVGTAAPAHDEDLPGPGRQAVCALDVTQIAAFEARMNSLTHLGKSVS